ncbi:MAG: PEP-CTERM sorting domain-containing protein [Pirellulales bacterium]|nr:PEP-CTERM sorting domain-containing protein [Pirellulales bacterium]
MGVKRILAVSFCLVLIVAASGRAATIWNEGVSGDLSDNQAAPNALAVAFGKNSIIGTAGGGNIQDWVSLQVPAGLKLKQIVLAAYASTDAQGFTGFQPGVSFVGSPFVPGSYAGYAHFGTGATNPVVPTNLVGQDLLPIMADPVAAAGSTGFVPPLGPGTYTFLIQQLGALTNYQFDYVVAPEPSTMMLVGLGALALAPWLRRRAAIGHRLPT